MRELKLTFFFSLLTLCSFLSAQNVTLEGYVYESGNRGYLNLVSVKVYDTSNNLITTTASDLSGIFNLELPLEQDLIVVASKDVFKEKKMAVSTKGKSPGEKLYLKVEMNRQPGYVFDVTLAAKQTAEQVKKQQFPEGITDARIEVYNNTKKKQVLDLREYAQPNFKVRFEDGNHYTIMIRKKRFFTKRMEAYVNVEGCILCFDGVGEVKPGVSDVLTEENSMGTLLANVELVPIELNKAIKIDNIYYDKSSAKIKKEAAEELDKLIVVLEDNPSLLIELGSHTDSRGDKKFNQSLSQRRAKSVVNYITNNSDVNSSRITAKGYGESKLVNRCADGVECSERKHRRNRRTEIKVTGILAEDPYSNLSLANIMQREQTDALLEEIMNQEIVEIKPGEKLPDEIARQIAGKENKTKEENTTKMESANDAPVEEVIEQVELVSATPKNEKQKTETPASKSNVVVNTPPQPTEPVLRKPSVRKKERIPEKNNTSNTQSNKIVKSLEVPISRQPSIPVAVASNFTGYLVEFYTSASELPSSHEIFSKHGKIFKEEKKDGSFGYMFGPFGEWRDANKFLQSAIIGNYNMAKVIRYKRGKRIQK